MANSQQPVILQVLHTLEIGGAEVLAARLARKLKDRYQFVFACLDGLGTLGRELREEGFVVEVLGRRDGIDWRCVRRLAAVADRWNANLTHAHQYTPFFYARAPGWIGRRPPVLFTEHGRFHPDLPSRKRMAFNRLFLRQSDRVVAVGEAVKRALINNEGISSRRIDVIYNGVELADFTASASMRGEVRQQLGIGPDVPVAIQVARLDYLKDHSTALRVAGHVREKLPNFQLLLVGEGPERSRIEAEIIARKLQNTVRLLGLRKDVRRLLAAADLFLLTSISEGIPVTLIEAMAADLPVVSTDVGGVSEVVVPNVTGFLTKAVDDTALAAAALQVLADRDMARRFAQAGARRAADIFSETHMHGRYAALYDSMIRRSTAAGNQLAAAVV